MYDATCPSEAGAPALAIRAAGAVRLAVELGARGSRVARLSEAGGFRLRFPDQERDECEAVLVNTGGGLTGGDSLALSVTAGLGARLLLTTQSAEKLYRSNGPDTLVSTELRLEEHSRLSFMPQETILFSGARLRRALAVEMPESACLIAAEAVVFGRLAMGETLGSGLFRDRWRIRRAGRLIFAEDVRLEGEIGAALARKAVADGARAAATLLYAAPEAEARLDDVRNLLTAARSEAGAACFDRLMIVRLLTRDPADLRRDLAACLALLRGAPLPRVWQC